MPLYSVALLIMLYLVCLTRCALLSCLTQYALLIMPYLLCFTQYAVLSMYCFCKVGFYTPSTSRLCDVIRPLD